MINASSMRSEFLNVRSTPTAKVLLVASTVMAAGSLIANLATFATADLSASATLEQAMHASTVATLTFALVAGVVGATSDFRFGRMDQLLLTAPRRWPVLATKSALGLLVGMVYGVAGSVVALGGVWSWYRWKEVPVDLTSDVVMLPLVGVIIGSGLFMIIGIATGVAVQNQPLALGGALGLLLIVQPTLLLGLPDIGRWLPGAAGLSLTLSPDPSLVGQVPGGLLLLGWTVLVLAVANHRLTSSDL